MKTYTSNLLTALGLYLAGLLAILAAFCGSAYLHFGYRSQTLQGAFLTFGLISIFGGTVSAVRYFSDRNRFVSRYEKAEAELV